MALREAVEQHCALSCALSLEGWLGASVLGEIWDWGPLDPAKAEISVEGTPHWRGA